MTDFVVLLLCISSLRGDIVLCPMLCHRLSMPQSPIFLIPLLLLVWSSMLTHSSPSFYLPSELSGPLFLKCSHIFEVPAIVCAVFVMLAKVLFLLLQLHSASSLPLSSSVWTAWSGEKNYSQSCCSSLSHACDRGSYMTCACELLSYVLHCCS